MGEGPCSKAETAPDHQLGPKIYVKWKGRGVAQTTRMLA